MCPTCIKEGTTEPTRSRTRTVTTPSAYGGTCLGDNKEKDNCKSKLCPIDCHYAKWSEWGECTKTCGSGKHERTREHDREAKYGGKKCEGFKKEKNNCNIKPCPTTTTTTTTTTTAKKLKKKSGAARICSASRYAQSVVVAAFLFCAVYFQ